MLAPIAQMTCIAMKMRPPSSGIPDKRNVPAKEITVTSISTSHAPRAKRKRASSAGCRRFPARPALTPASNTNTGAQKCVTQRVRNRAGPTFGFAIGSCSAAIMKKSRTWSRAMITMTSPRTMSTEVRR